MNRWAVANFGVSAFLAGLIWTIQLLHYPLFAMVPPEVFVAYMDAHRGAITWLVGPAMVLELVLGLGWLAATRQPVRRMERAACLGLTLLAWAATVLLAVPLHVELARGWDPQAHAELVQTNWFRTFAWSVRTLYCGWIVWVLGGAAARPPPAA